VAPRGVAPAFHVIRRCPPGECDPDCNCHVVEHRVDVDELLPDELLHFQVAGDAAQRAEIAAWRDPTPGLARATADPGRCPVRAVPSGVR
jgi:hypothetical protein